MPESLSQRLSRLENSVQRQRRREPDLSKLTLDELRKLRELKTRVTQPDGSIDRSSLSIAELLFLEQLLERCQPECL